MIAKSIKAKSFAGCVNYVMKKDSEVLKAEGVMALDAKSIIDSFEFQRSGRPEIKSPVGHIPISFAPEDRDKMSNELMVKLGEEYMQKMGIVNTQYLIVRHHDGANEHFHIIYNRIDNDRKLISLHNDYKRNEQVSKEIKRRYGLTFGKDKSRVNREKLVGRERVRYAIHDAVLSKMSSSRDIFELRERLRSHGVRAEIKYRRGSNVIDGVSFSKGEYKFKASQIDRKLSYKNLEIAFAELRKKSEHSEQSTYEFKHRITKRIGGVTIPEEQRIALDNRRSVYLEGLKDRSGNIYNAYVKLAESGDKLDFYHNDPDRLQGHNMPQHQESQPAQEPQSEKRHEQSNDDGGGVLSIFDMPMPSNGADQDDIDNAEMAKNLQQKKKRRGMRM